MKKGRQEKILEIISKNNIETQEELIEALKKEGIVATQATASRDIRQLKLLKVMSDNGTYKYVYLNNGKVHGYNSNGSSAQFKLYPVEAPSSSTVEVPVRTINPATGQAEDVEQISRNDFINAIVKVSYSKNKGHFTFEVRDWYTGGGDVEFN